MNVLQKVHHPHCVQFFGAVTKQKPFMIITEFMGCGSMADMFRGGETPSLRRAVQLALDCARGIAYLHNHNPLSIIHRCGRGISTQAWKHSLVHIGWGCGCSAHVYATTNSLRQVGSVSNQQQEGPWYAATENSASSAASPPLHSTS